MNKLRNCENFGVNNERFDKRTAIKGNDLEIN
ncbi:hypothetical protein [uncultured Mediterranean phage uvMED]|nr:hypothetical protein [uncultured Mediterranean phage uvMED]